MSKLETLHYTIEFELIQSSAFALIHYLSQTIQSR